MGLKDRLSTLNRQFREIEITSLDGENKETAYYRRPTEIEDNILRKAMNEEYEEIVKGLKEGEQSVYATLVDMFEKSNPTVAVDVLVAAQLDGIRSAAVRELGKDEPDKDATEDERKAFVEELRPFFDEKLKEVRAIIEADPPDVIAEKAAQSRIESIARDRAFEVYRRRLVAQSIFEKDEQDDQFKLAFDSFEEVPKYLDTDTINTLTTKILEEMRRVKPLPLK